MCTPKKLLHRQQALINVIKREQPIKIRPPVRHQSCTDTRREAEELVEKYARLLRRRM
jgi:hypothetical protein